MESVLLSGVRELNPTSLARETAINAVKRLQQQSLSQNKDKMTLEEINHEIKMARRQMNT